MFVDSGDTSRVGRIVGIDPGTTTMGLSLIEYDLDTLIIQRSCAYTLNAGRMPLSELDVLSHSERYARIFELMDILYKLFVQIQPHHVISESAFMSRRMPTAYGALSEVIFAVRLALRRYDPGIPLDLIDPPSAKRAVGASGKAKKDEVHTAIKKLVDDLCFDSQYSAAIFDNLDEHSVDALAIAYSKWSMIVSG